MSYNLLNPVRIINAQSMATSITSNPVEVKNQDNVGIQMHWTGNPSGTFEFQASENYLEDAEGNVRNAGDWVTLPVAPPIVAAGTADDAMVDLNNLSVPYVRIKYTAGSGAGTLDAYVAGKGV